MPVTPSTSTIIRVDRIVSWVLVGISVLTILSGYIHARGLADPTIFLPLHQWSKVAFTGLLITHLGLTLFIPSYWRNLWLKIRSRRTTNLNWIKLAQRISGYLIVVMALLVILTGLDWYGLGIREFFPFVIHARYDLFLTILIGVHVVIGARFALSRRRISGSMVNAGLLGFLIFTTLFIGYFDSGRNFVIQPPVIEEPIDGTTGLTLPSPPNNTRPVRPATINIEGQFFSFNPEDIQTVRPDLFNPGFFSLFDVLVYLDSQNEIPLEYHFNPLMNTYTIDNLYNHQYWWYEVTYSGGWSENNVFRMDHYPWKDGTNLRVFKILPSELEEIHAVWQEEVSRQATNNGAIIIPHVSIQGYSIIINFYNVTVTAHNLRSDIFPNNTITAIDAIFSLADSGDLTFELQWYETIGSASIVKSFWIESINEERTDGRCGWVYESGDYEFVGFRGNHIHLPSDTRVLNSPEYLVYFWICV